MAIFLNWLHKIWYYKIFNLKVCVKASTHLEMELNIFFIIFEKLGATGFTNVKNWFQKLKKQGIGTFVFIKLQK